MFNGDQLAVIEYCSLEVMRQRTGPEKVACMLRAWDYATRKYEENKRRWPRVDDILVIGKLVEPYVNRAMAFRTLPINIGPKILYPFDYHPVLSAWHAAVTEGRINADEAYKEFEEIHPFLDGNGRTGKVLYNWILGRLRDPVMPPNFWGSDNP